MKMQLYPSKEQSEQIDRIFRALHVAYNITFHEVFQENPAVCTKRNANGDVWPDFKKIASSAWQKQLKETNRIIAEAPAASITTNNGLFLLDGKRAWKVGMGNRPVSKKMRKDFRFYNAKKPRHSFMVQIQPKDLMPSEGNGKVAWIKLPKFVNRIKARGFNRKLWFGEKGTLTYMEAVQAGIWKTAISVRVSKDTCDKYYVSVTFSDGKDHDRDLYLETAACSGERTSIGMDVGIKDIAILSNGEKIENKHFKAEKNRALRKLNRQLSGRWGPANEAYRNYNRIIREENKARGPDEKVPLSEPSKRYLAAKSKKAVIEQKIARRRDTYYHQQTARLTRDHSVIAVETLLVKNLLRNHKLAFALSDAAMSDFLSKLKYKANRFGTEIISIGTFEPSSQRCSECGYIHKAVKNLSVRSWTCPQCKAVHDRDINAAKNILSIALTKGGIEDTEIKLSESPKPKSQNRKRRNPGECPVSEQHPEIVIVFSKDLTRIKDPRYIIIDKKSGTIVDNANGAGFRSISNARNCYKAKKNWSEKNRASFSEQK